MARLAWAAPVGLVLAWATAAAVDASQADALRKEADRELQAWISLGLRPEPSAWEAARGKLVEARRLQPGDPGIEELLGFMGSVHPDDPVRLREGIAHFARALELRPASPYTWAALLEAQYRLGEPGSRMEIAMRRAVELGYAEPAIQRIVTDFGLAAWRELSPAGQASLEVLLAAGMRRNPLEMLRISQRRGRLDLACRHLADADLPGHRGTRACMNQEVTP